MITRNLVFNLAITTRSPLHIGNGRALVRDYDFVFDEGSGTAYVLDDEAVVLLAEQELGRRDQGLRRRIKQYDDKPARQQTDREAQQLIAEGRELKDLRRRVLTGLALDQLLDARLLSVKRHLEPRGEVDGRPLVRYTLTGDLSRSDEVNEQIKDAYGRPYLPGSSLKGAIRTALAWQHFPALGRAVGLAALIAPGKQRPPRAEFADDVYNDALFVMETTERGGGATANRDLLRLFQVSDSSPATPDALTLAPVTVYNGQPAASPYGQRRGGVRAGFDVLNVEALAAGVTLTASVQIETYAFAEVRRGLDFAARRAWLTEFAAACRARGAARIATELAYHRERGPATLERFYAALAEEQRGLPEHSFLAQVGWGAGWRSKTLDDRLQADPVAFAELVRAYKLDEPNKREASSFRPDDRFPASRKLVLNNGQPWQPLGWLRVDVAEVAR